MKPGSAISYIEHTAIDRTAWDDCINRFAPDHIYACSWYLDIMAPGWCALVKGHYEAVMPLPCRVKFGIHYLYQPFLTAQLGLVADHPDEKLLDAFLQSIPRKYRYWDICLNHSNLLHVHDFPLKERINLVLPLHGSYSSVQAGYNENTLRNIRKAEKSGLLYKKDLPIEAIIQLTVQQAKIVFTDADWARLIKLSQLLAAQQKAFTRYVTSPDGTLLASALFFTQHTRIYYILPGNTPDSRNTGASHWLIDQLIQELAGQQWVLDFEGSDTPSVAQFYRAFGAVEENYPALRVDRLPLLLRWLKR